MFHKSVLPACVSVYHVWAWCKWKAEEGPRYLELELGMAVNSHVGADQVLVLCKAAEPSATKLAVTPDRFTWFDLRVCAWRNVFGLQSPEEGVESPEQLPSSVQEQEVLSAAEPSLRPLPILLF